MKTHGGLESMMKPAPYLIAACAALLLSAFPAFSEPRYPLLERNVRVLESVKDPAYGAPAPETPPGEPLLLDPELCAAMAVSRNPQVAASAAKVDEARSLTGVARAARMPQVKGAAAYNYVDGLETEVFGSSLTRTLLNASDFAPKKGTATAQIGVEQVLYAGGQIRAAVRASEYLARAEEWKKQAELISLAAEARTACYDAMLAGAMIKVAEDSVAVFERHLADARNRLDQGMASRFEILRAETEIRARESDLESARTLERLALLNLRRILHLEEDRPVSLAGELPWNPLDTPVGTLVAEALKDRPELMALDAAMDAARENITVKKGAWLPKAAASLKYQQVAGGGQLAPNGFTVTMGGEWELYAGGKRKHELAGAEAQLRGLEQQRAGVARLVETDVRQAHARALEAVAKIRKEEAALALGEEGLSLAELRFQQGVGIQADTLDAELALTTAKTGLAKALRDYAAALADLDKALGRGLPAAACDGDGENPAP